ncbi:autotransporter-associated beta strand repeat-containing protein, partial [Brucella oryzae]
HNAHDNTLSGIVAGTGTLTKTGAGVLTLAGNNTYVGGTAITAGTLQIGNGGTTGRIMGDAAIDAGAALAFNRSNSLTFGGVVSGAGRVVQAGSGTTVLTGTNSYSGGTAITAGTLSVGADNNLGAAAGGVEIGVGTLQLSAAFHSGRAITPGASAPLTLPPTA